VPEQLISWTRLLAGRMRDPMVGRDALIGVVAGLIHARRGVSVTRFWIDGASSPHFSRHQRSSERCATRHPEPAKRGEGSRSFAVYAAQDDETAVRNAG